MGALTPEQRMMFDLIQEAKKTNQLLEQLIDAVNSANAKLSDISHYTHTMALE